MRGEPTPDPTADIPETFGLPFGPYALDQPPPQESILFTGATLWTCADDPRVIEHGTLWINEGTIAFVGTADEWADFAARARFATPPREVDARGLHITPGLIDCHSHTGISGSVNEAAQAVSAEVRIQDVTDPDDINWYRQLAGGLTAANCLHGSANPIGGQNCVVKLRWGVAAPDDMHFDAAPPGIKFALGENVKQSNWGDRSTVRYPQTRMGVETLIRDRFVAARQYAAARASAAPPRRDLELDALAEILAGHRLVHCHSYRQDEILMLCRVASDFGFTIGTFQHILEGYKVAEEVRDHARGASAFSDWWAYKVEVQDAIPFAGAIMHDVGVCVSFNSDSDELARRMNTEAAKAVKYGNLSPQRALQFVTLNPARQLAIDHRVGSLEVGKDADLALWSHDPLSTFAVCHATYVDGRRYFSLEQDRLFRERIAAERQRLIRKVLAQAAASPARGRSRPSTPDAPAPSSLADHDADARRQHALDLLRWGKDPDAHRCGDCGMSEAHSH